MTTRTIMVAASGGSASEGAIELGCRWAVRLAAHLECFHVLNDPREALAMAGGDIGIAAPELFEQLSADAEIRALKTKASFDAIARRHRLPLHPAPQAAASGPAPSACWRQETGYAPTLVARRARFFDLVVLGRSERVVAGPYTRTIEETLEAAGRPVLLAPTQCPAVVGSSVAVAWNGSTASVRAIAAALPLLAEAAAVSVIMIGRADEPDTLAALVEYLAWHGISAAHRVLPQAAGKTVAEALLGAAEAANADLLVMGGYGRRPWREALFGGTTRELLALPTMPLLLAH